MLEILAHVVDLLAVPDQLRFARASKRSREIVYEDSRWVRRLRIMGCWNEGEARRRKDSSLQTTPGGVTLRSEEESTAIRSNGLVSEATHHRVRDRMVSPADAKSSNRGFEEINLSYTSGMEQAQSHRIDEHTLPLHIFSTVQSMRGRARQEYCKVYRSLYPFYKDAITCTVHTNALVFQKYRDPDHQARMLSNLSRFARSDCSDGWSGRVERLTAIEDAFQVAVTRELEHGIEIDDLVGKVRKYCYVLTSLGRQDTTMDILLSKSKELGSDILFDDPSDFIHYRGPEDSSSQPTFRFFSGLSAACKEQLSILEKVLPPGIDFLEAYFQRVEKIISHYLSNLLIQAKGTRLELYLKAVSITYRQCIAFGDSLNYASDPPEKFPRAMEDMIKRIFDPHATLYLDQEYAFFKLKLERDVGNWETQLSEQDENMQTMYMANVNRHADKRDFLSSFKKVVMMPVNVLPSFPSVSPFGAKSATAKALVNGETQATTQPGNHILQIQSQNPTASPGNTPDISRASSPHPVVEAPTTELAAKAAIMTTRMEGIRSLFSIEVALNLVHSTKSSIERATVFVIPEGAFAEKARRQCLLIFVLLLQTLGTRHIRAGFDKALEHLTSYNPRKIADHTSNRVTPLVTFLELVNVGDLIQQMLDVFYEQELIATHLAERDDLLDPATKEKKRFESMLDERVAAGLNKGIEVLISEVEYLCATTQKPEDYNPESVTDTTTSSAPDPTQPSATARQIIDCISSHTSMLSNSTDAPLLDVFNQEVGLRLWSTLCKHLKRQRISTTGAVTLIADTSLYYNFICTSLARKKSQADLRQYFESLRELSMLYLVDVEGRGKDGGKELAALVADQGGRWRGVWRAEEVLEFVERRADWLVIRGSVEKAMFGQGCTVM